MTAAGDRPDTSVPPPGRVRRIATAGLIDSFGLSLGWTVFNLHAVQVHGLGSVGLFGAAMLIGVALSAPVAGWLAARVHGRRLLRGTAVVEAILRLGVFVLLLTDVPLLVIAGAITLMNVISWTAYAGMRAEIAAVDARAAAMTWYAVVILSIEAVGAATAAVLPTSADGLVSGTLLYLVITVHAGALLPQFLVARGSRVPRAAPVPRGSTVPYRVPALAGAAAIMLLGSGPTLIAVGLAAELHGRQSVAIAAVAFTLGTFLAPALASLLERRRLRPALTWPLLGAGMIVGWAAAPLGIAGLLAAQLLSGLSMSTFEGTVDAHIAARNPDTGATAGLAWSAAARALGSAVAVGAAPAVVGTVGLPGLSGGAALALCAFAAVGVRAQLRRAPALRPRADGVPVPSA